MEQGKSLGAHLRDCREARGRSAEDLSIGTRIAPRVVRALEKDRLAELPAPVFVRGFIRAYCAEVGEDAGYALRLYEARTARASLPAVPARALPAASLISKVAPERSRSRRGRLLAPLLVVTGLVGFLGSGVHLLTSSELDGTALAPLGSRGETVRGVVVPSPEPAS